MLQKLNLDLETACLEVEKLIGNGQETKMVGDKAYTPRVKKVLALAGKEAIALNHSFVGTEHILLGILLEGEGVAARVLKYLGIDIENTRNEIHPNVTIDTSDCVSINVNADIGDLKKRGPSLPIIFMPDENFALVSKSVKEHAVTAQLDTGANHSCISQELANNLNISPSGEVLQHGAGQEAKNTPAYKATVTFPKGTEVTAEFAVLPSMHNDHDVLIGRDILSLGKLVVDFTTGKWSIHFKK